MTVDPSTLRILSFPAPALLRKAAPVPRVDAEVRAVAQRMLELMVEAEGVGLAAPQVGLSWRLFVTNSGAADEPDRVYVNPRLVRLEGELVAADEGCLSLPGIRADIRRQPRATITATDLEGREFTLTSEDLLARAWQHEMDHLDGVLIIHRMTPI